MRITTHIVDLCTAMLEGIADVTIHLNGGYKNISREEIIETFRKSL